MLIKFFDIGLNEYESIQQSIKSTNRFAVYWLFFQRQSVTMRHETKYAYLFFDRTFQIVQKMQEI